MRVRARYMSNAALLMLLVAASGCTVGPKYHRPDAPVATKWDVSEPWREAAPKDSLPRGAWWAVFHNDELNGLEQQAVEANENVKVSLARLEQARAAAAIQVSTLFPTFATAPSFTRQQLSGTRASFSNLVPVTGPLRQSAMSLPFTVSYEVDLFGRRRRSIESTNAQYQATAADLENVRLLVASQVAGDYFTLRQLDTEIGILTRTVETLERGLQLVQQRHQGGVASGLDVAQEETLLNATKAQAILVRQQRKQVEDALATLIGKPAPDFHLPSKELSGAPPTLDTGLTSDLLERRPDIAEAERLMAAQNAQIGVAKSAYYPSLNLFGQGGWESAHISKLLTAGSGVWALGATAAENIFTGGARRAQVQVARAGYQANVASYRQTVLSAFQEVQDDLTSLIVLEQAQRMQQDAVDAARRALNISTSRYAGGLVSYLDVVTAQQTLLTNEQQLAVIQGQRLVSSVLLVKALGGGWDPSSIASLQLKPRLKDAFAP